MSQNIDTLDEATWGAHKPGWSRFKNSVRYTSRRSDEDPEDTNASRYRITSERDEKYGRRE